MFNLLLNIYNGLVLGDTTTSDGIPDGVASGLDFDSDSFITGIFIGIIIAFIIMGIVKYAKYIIKDNKEMQEKLNSQKSDDK